jgi:hypothetical protein
MMNELLREGNGMDGEVYHMWLSWRVKGKEVEYEQEGKRY